MKCQIRWVDENGIPTPDQNEAVAFVLASSEYRGEVFVIGDKTPIPICAEHLKQMKPVHISWPGSKGEVKTTWEVVGYPPNFDPKLERLHALPAKWLRECPCSCGTKCATEVTQILEE